MNVPVDNDTELVAASLTGDRAAFGRIVSRYQSLVCAVTYSATGNLTLSEDVAQETFVAAWRQLADLREPAKLRSWLCGIARNLLHNTLRRLGREPSQIADSIEAAAEINSPEEAPATQAIRREEEAILWQALERIPELYRAPLILFYREGRSVEQTAALLDLSEEVVRQRLTRGRKQLAEEVTAFVEGTLLRSAPGVGFAPAVLAALPPLALPVKIAALGATAKGGLGAKALGAGALFANLVLSPLLILAGNYTSYRMALETAASERERDVIRKFYRRLGFWAAAMTVIFPAAIIWRRPLAEMHSLVPLGLAAGIVVLGTGAIFAAMFRSWRTRHRLMTEPRAFGDLVLDPRPAYEYRSTAELFGWPLVHFRLSRGISGGGKPVKAWIAAGDCAIGRLAAYGGVAIAPVSVGGVAIGLVAVGGCAVGALSFAGFAFALWAWGGMAVGWQAEGGCAIAWQFAVGGAALARDFALGAIAHAAEANSGAARQLIRELPFFRAVQAIGPFSLLLHLVWVTPLVLWRRMIARRTVAEKGAMLRPH